MRFTPDNGKKASFRGRLTKISNRYSLQHQGKQLSLLEVNTDLRCHCLWFCNFVG